jgi:hypothetical protein
MTIEAMLMFALTAAIVFGLLWAAIEGGDKLANVISRRRDQR